MAKSAPEPSTDVATIDASKYPIMSPQVDVVSALRENVGTSLGVFDLDRVKIPTGGQTFWSIETLEGDTEAVKSLDGIVVAWKDPRAFWKDSFGSSGGNSPPDCSSDDGKYGIGEPGGPCATCQYAQFGTAVNDKGEPTDGQACKQMRLILMVRPGELLPTAVWLPPTSLKPIKKLFLKLTSQGKFYSDVEMGFTLDVQKNKGGIDFSVAQPRVLRTLEPEERVAIREYASVIGAALSSVTLSREDVVDAPSGGIDDGQ